MWLVIAPSTDGAAWWTLEGLRHRGLDPIEAVTAEELASARHWRHRLREGAAHPAETHITLADGRVIDGGTVRGTLNRVIAPWPDPTKVVGPGDRAYAEQEVYALYMSWLRGMPGVVLNRPDARALVGGFKYPAEWALHAAKAGLAVDDYRFDSGGPAPVLGGPLAMPEATVSMFAIGESVVGPLLDGRLIQGCRRLRAASGVEALLEIGFARGEGGWVFTGASPMPDLRRGGDRLLDALADFLR